MHDAIRIRGARQNNLKGVDLDLPHRRLTVLTGPSGSGKSSLAFDTVYAEGQRRYIESLSTYAKQFLERMEKPAVDRVEGISPSVAIDQKNSVQTSRSTVGTVTEVYDHLRLLWARVGHTHCPECDRRVTPDTVASAADRILSWEPGTRFLVTFPFAVSEEITHAVAVANLTAQGYLRVLADGEELYLPELGEERDGEPSRADLTTAGELLVVVDRLTADPEDRERLTDALAAAFAEGEGRSVVVTVRRDAEAGLVPDERHPFTEAFRCSECGRDFPEPRPALFSFNHPSGACPECRGFGATLEYDEDLIVPDPGRSLAEGALDPWTKPRYGRQRKRLLEFARERGLDESAPWRELPAGARRELLHGSPDFQGMLPFLRSRESKKYKRYIRVFLRKYQTPRRCPSCGGARLRPEALHVRVGGERISEATSRSVESLRSWLADLEPSPFEAKIAATILEELRDRLRFLDEVGLGYLTLDRQARTLSGGEMQRIRLASCLGSHLVDTTYVLDEPTIGLHPRDVERFVRVLEQLRDVGNTLLVVEHDPEVLRAADHLVELGPESGERGGEVVLQGEWPDLLAADTTTGRALRQRGGGGRKSRAPSGRRLRLLGATLHNVRDVDLEVPLGLLNVVTGVSGSGKSTLVHDLLFHALEREMHGETSAKEHLGESTGRYRRLEGVGYLDDVVLVDQSPIGRTPRSNPVTYIKAFGEIRRLFADQPLARRRGFGTGHFSFNVKGGRCERCKGAGEEQVEMVFMADVYVPCEACGGKRYRPEILEVEYRGRNIHDVLRLTVDEAIRFFLRQDRLGQALWQLQRVGLGYLKLGQPATTLSGGEAQRLKVARELARAAGSGRRLYLLDEPTVGLGLGEIGQLVDVLDQLVEAGHTVLLVEHNLDVVARADWIVDLGPEAAEEGGRIVAQGPPAKVAEAPTHTGRFLREHLDRTGSTRPGESARRTERSVR